MRTYRAMETTPEDRPPKRRPGRPAITRAEPVGEVQSLDRAIGLLDRIASGEGISLSQLARQAELAPSTVHRLLATLVHRNLVSHDAETGLWTVGVGLFRMGAGYLRIRKLPEIARPIIRRLAEELDETVNLAMLDGRELICVAQVEAHAPVRAFFRLGRRLPLHASAAGKAILGAGSDAFRAQLLEGVSLHRMTPNTLTGRSQLLSDVMAAASRGWATEDEEQALGMRCVAAAVLNEFGEPAAAVSICAPVVRLAEVRLPVLGGQVKRAAEHLSLLYSGLRPGSQPGPA